jgi:radical SAM-linked protein
MRVFQRAFKRAGMLLKHTQGFNPRPSVSIALPLSVGVESECELLDFDLDGQQLSCEEIKDRLNQALISGIQVLQVYDDGQKLKHLKYLKCQLLLEYDLGVSDGTTQAIVELFRCNELKVEKKGKIGTVEQDIIPMIRHLDVATADANTVIVDATVCCQEPSLNPAQLINAINKYLPQLKPDFSKCRRIELLDADENIFR